MYKALDFSLIHVRAKSWAEKVFDEYQEGKRADMPRDIPPETGVGNGEDKQEFADIRGAQGAPDNLY